MSQEPVLHFQTREMQHKAETTRLRAESARLRAKRAALKAHRAYQRELQDYKRSKSRVRKVGRALGKLHASQYVLKRIFA